MFCVYFQHVKLTQDALKYFCILHKFLLKILGRRQTAFYRTFAIYSWQTSASDCLEQSPWMRCEGWMGAGWGVETGVGPVRGPGHPTARLPVWDVAWELVRNAEPQVPVQTYLIRTCMLTRCPDSSAHSSVRSTDLEQWFQIAHLESPGEL